MLSNLSSKDTRMSMIVVLKYSLILCWLGWAVFYSMAASINIPTTHLDGAFQTASGLYRLDAGQFPGENFYPYLGIGPLLSLYPFFKVFGANISASVFSAQLVVLLIGVLSTAFIWQLIWRPKSTITSLTAGSILFLAPIGASIYFSLSLPDWMIQSSSPGNSLRPVRVVAPYIVSIIYYYFIFHIDLAQKKFILSGLLTGSILLWSNDFAIPSAGLFAFFILINALGCNELQIKNVLVYFIATILSWIMLIALVTHGHPVELLRYNFLDVAQDQWWFFGPYGESTRIFNYQQLNRLFSQQNYHPLLILFVVTILAIRTRLVEHALLLWIGCVLFAGGVVASVGGHLSEYFGGFYFWGAMVVFTGFFHFIWIGFSKLFSHRSLIILIASLIALGLSIFLTINALSHYKSELSNAKNDSNRFFAPELGGYLTREWSDYIDLARNSNELVVVEEYWGLWSATRKTFSSWPVDSVIHALGETRKVAAKGLQRADIIISTRSSISPEWQPWNLSQNYWFYENLLSDWVAYRVSPTTIVWKKHKREQLRLFKAVDCTVVSINGLPSLILTVADTGFYEIDMQYKFFGNGRFLTMIRNNISFGGDANGYVSIDPKATSVKFPVYFEKAGAVTLDTKIVGNIDFNFDIKSCAAKHIPIMGNDILRIPGTFDDSFFLTDSNWLHGIARRWAGFFVPNTTNFAEKYKKGRFVKFIDGESREIMLADPSGLYLNIYLSGEPLDPEKVGLPTQHIVIDKVDHNPKEGGK